MITCNTAWKRCSWTRGKLVECVSSPSRTIPHFYQCTSPLFSPLPVIHQNHIALRNKKNTSVPPSLLTIEDETTAVNYRVNKRIPEAISAAWQIRKNMALGQEGVSHPGRIPSSLLGTIYLMRKKNQTFINQLNKKMRWLIRIVSAI